jgi:hypothetical protein
LEAYESKAAGKEGRSMTKEQLREELLKTLSDAMVNMDEDTAREEEYYERDGIGRISFF